MKSISLSRSVNLYSKGSILLISIWMLAIFSIFAVGLYKIGLSQIRLSQRLEALTLSRHAVASLCKYVRSRLNNDETIYDTLWELAGEKKRKLGFAELEYKLIDTESRININLMPGYVLKRLPGINKSVVDDIVDIPLRPFYVKEELLMIDGIDEDVFSQFSGSITLYSNGKINLNTASSDVLSCLGLDEDLIDIIMLFRSGMDEEQGTEDDGIFDAKASILDTLRSFSVLSVAQEAELIKVMEWLDVQGENFLLNVEVKVLGKRAGKYNIILNKDGIVQWRER